MGVFGCGKLDLQTFENKSEWTQEQVRITLKKGVESEAGMITTNECPSPAALAGYFERVDCDEAVHKHVYACLSCREALKGVHPPSGVLWGLDFDNPLLQRIAWFHFPFCEACRDASAEFLIKKIRESVAEGELPSNACAREVELFEFWAEWTPDSGSGDPALATHVESCQICSSLLAAYCPSEELLVDHIMEKTEGLLAKLLAKHIKKCKKCRLEGHCPSWELLARYIMRKTKGPLAELLEKHIKMCKKCRDTSGTKDADVPVEGKMFQDTPEAPDELSNDQRDAPTHRMMANENTRSRLFWNLVHNL